MTFVAIALAFIVGAVFWHWLGGILLRRVGLDGSLRADVLKNLDTDTLTALRREAEREMNRRAAVLSANTENGG